ncbi:hypothetical protein [Limnohabitans sp. DM1]|uniref:hypothetical protein n=1 Tax=Limnohabitans sp. DM1 TaxID=1597955 RepID=UPI000A7E7B77|nr:hypothetical protein [Limnohabitans sp. DM1]
MCLGLRPATDEVTVAWGVAWGVAVGWRRSALEESDVFPRTHCARTTAHAIQT